MIKQSIISNVDVEEKLIEPEIIKVDNTTLQVSTIIPQATEICQYDYDFLLEQKDRIQANIERETASLNEVLDLISNCESLGMTPKIIEGEQLDG